MFSQDFAVLKLKHKFCYPNICSIWLRLRFLIPDSSQSSVEEYDPVTGLRVCYLDFTQLTQKKCPSGFEEFLQDLKNTLF